MSSDARATTTTNAHTAVAATDNNQHWGKVLLPNRQTWMARKRTVKPCASGASMSSKKDRARYRCCIALVPLPLVDPITDEESVEEVSEMARMR